MKSPPDHKPKITLFTAPKSFNDLHINIIQRNSLRNWQNLGDDILVVVIGDDEGIADVSLELGYIHIPGVRTNEHGTPLLSSIFSLAHEVNEAPLLAYCNADILFLPDFMTTIQSLINLYKPFLGVGRRWDIDIQKNINFSTDWEDNLFHIINSEGIVHEQSGSDYFIFPHECFNDIPDFSVGRAGWDNWMIYKARWQHWPVIDLTYSLTAVHQNHDYGHLAGGRKHFFQPESTVNVKLAGGRRNIFTLVDTTHELKNGHLHRRKLDKNALLRRIETFPLVGLRSRFFGWIFFVLFHPHKAFNEVKGWANYKFSAVFKKNN